MCEALTSLDSCGQTLVLCATQLCGQILLNISLIKNLGGSCSTEGTAKPKGLMFGCISDLKQYENRGKLDKSKATRKQNEGEILSQHSLTVKAVHLHYIVLINVAYWSC